jgi:hypothetical protein
LNALQQRIAQLNADLNKRQDEYSEMIAGLTKSHEEQSSRQAAHLASVMEQRISEANVSSAYSLHCGLRDPLQWCLSYLAHSPCNASLLPFLSPNVLFLTLS